MKSLYASVLNFYRRSIKRVPRVHTALYWMGEQVVVPILERLRRFRTIPDEPLFGRLELLLGQYEFETVSYFKRVIKPGMICLDIGANVGYHTRLFARLVGLEGRVIAFEPHSVAYEFLKDNVQGLHNVTVLNLAASDHEGTMPLYDIVAIGSAASSLALHQSKMELAESLHQEHYRRASSRKLVRTYSVRVSTVDNVLPMLGIRGVDLVKIDVEGAELGVIQGMTKTLQQSPSAIIVFELNPLCLESFNTGPNDLFELLEGIGYKEFTILDQEMQHFTPGEELFQHLCNKLYKEADSVNIVARREK